MDAEKVVRHLADKGLVVVNQAVQCRSITLLGKGAKPFIHLLHGRFPALRQTARFPADRSVAVPVLPAWLLPCPKHYPAWHEVIKSLTRYFYPSMMEFFNSEEGRREYEGWLKEQETLNAAPIAA